MGVGAIRFEEMKVFERRLAYFFGSIWRRDL